MVARASERRSAHVYCPPQEDLGVAGLACPVGVPRRRAPSESSVEHALPGHISPGQNQLGLKYLLLLMCLLL